MHYIRISDISFLIAFIWYICTKWNAFFLYVQEELFLSVGGKNTNGDKGVEFLKGSLFDFELSNLAKSPQFNSIPEELLHKNSESSVLSRFGAVFFEYSYTLDIVDDDNGYFESMPVVKEALHQRIIVGPSMCQITSGVFHRLEMVMEFSEDDANVRKGIK